MVYSSGVGRWWWRAGECEVPVVEVLVGGWGGVKVRGGRGGELRGLFHEPAEGARHAVFLSYLYSRDWVYWFGMDWMGFMVMSFPLTCWSVGEMQLVWGVVVAKWYDDYKRNTAVPRPARIAQITKRGNRATVREERWVGRKKGK